MPTIVVISLATFAFTLLGGLFALRFKDKLHLVLGFSAGAVLGVAFFDLIPESIELGEAYFSVATLTGFTALGFAGYLILDRTIFLHAAENAHHHDDATVMSPKEKQGILGAGSLAFHSFLDGVAIGLAFQVSEGVGAVVAAAVLVHDFSDGINTVNFILKSEGSKAVARTWLFIDALAPVLGAVSTMFFTLPQHMLAIVLSVFAGFFLYIGASDLVPESHHGHPKVITTVMTLLGMIVLYIAVTLAGV